MIETLQTPANLTQIVYQHLWHEIASLHLMPGEKLSEVKLAKEFSCSRIPVREAVHLLAAEDALEARPQRGSFVTLINVKQLERIRYLREALEYKIMMDGYHSGCFESIVPYLESLVTRQEELLNASAYELAFQLDRAIVESIKNHDETGLQKAIFGHLNNVNIMFNKLHPELEQYVCRN